MLAPLMPLTVPAFHLLCLLLRQKQPAAIHGKDKHVEEAVKMWARDCTKGGGGHGIRKAGPTFAKSRGCRLRFQCAKDPNRTEDCKWECSFEESATGWILVHAVWEHNGHALLESAMCSSLTRRGGPIAEV